MYTLWQEVPKLVYSFWTLQPVYSRPDKIFIKSVLLVAMSHVAVVVMEQVVQQEMMSNMPVFVQAHLEFFF